MEITSPKSLGERLNEFIVTYTRDVKTFDTTRYSVFPIEHPELYAFYQKQRDMFWVTAEIDFSNDRQSWDSLPQAEREFLLFILFFFSQADGIVMENLSSNFQEEVPFKEAKAFYAMQNAIEMIHAETYATMIETVIRDEETKRRAFDAIQYCEEITNMAAWASFWMSREHDLGVRIFAFAVYEGIFFNVGFIPIRWLGGGDKNKVPGFVQLNELISRDETLHMNFAPVILKKLGFHGNPKYQEHVKEIVSSSFGIMQKLIKRSLGDKGFVGMTPADMIAFTKTVYNRFTKWTGFGRFFPPVENPFPKMLPNKTNFFEHRVTEYRKVSDKDYSFRELEDGTW